jgi:hypothetical protein
MEIVQMNDNSTIVFDTSLEVKKMNGHIVNWYNLKQQIENECDEYERAAMPNRGSYWSDIPEYLDKNQIKALKRLSQRSREAWK